MSAEKTSTNPVVQAVISGRAPRQARVAAARGLLPLSQGDMLEVLVALVADEDAEISDSAGEALASQESVALLEAAQSAETSPAVLAHLAGRAARRRTGPCSNSSR
jgi:hypothetical protein